MKLKKVRSLGELRQLARSDSNYEKLAIIAAQNLGGSPKNLDDALHWIDINASESGSERGVVGEINFCISLVK
jgi:hypothetical protein